MKAYLIDPFEEEVREIDYEYKGDLDLLYNLLECSHVDCVECITKDGIYVDDEGLLSAEEQKFFYFPGYAQPLAGRGLFVGPTNEDGNTTEPTLTVKEVTALVIYGEPNQLGGMANFCSRLVNMTIEAFQREIEEEFSRD